MKQKPLYRLAFWIASLIIASVFFMGAQKILHPAEFAKTVYRFRLLPGGLVNLTAIYLPWLEVVSAACLLFVPRLRVAALWIILLLLIGFTIGIGINLVRGASFGCGCFGFSADERPLDFFHIVRNSALMILVVLALISHRRMK